MLWFTAGARTLMAETLGKHYFVFYDLGHSIVVLFFLSFFSVIVVVFNVIIISIKILGIFLTIVFTSVIYFYCYFGFLLFCVFLSCKFFVVVVHCCCYSVCVNFILTFIFRGSFISTIFVCFVCFIPQLALNIGLVFCFS